jgi:magnesium transporter
MTSRSRTPGIAADELGLAGTTDVALIDQVPVADPDTPIGELHRVLTARRFDVASHVVACRNGYFVGLARIEDVLSAAATDTLGAVIDADAPSIQEHQPDEVAAWKAVRHGESALAVTDAAGRFVGLVPPRRIVEVLLTEHDEDLARLGGYLASTASARHATDEALATRLGHRLPWLVLGLLGAIAAAGIVGSFEHRLEHNLTLAFFVPGVVYMADAVGTQTEAIVIRGLSVGVTIATVVRRELLTGLVIGTALAAAFVPVGMLLWADGRVVVTVAIALFAACSTATVVAMALPWALSRTGRDPAFGSGPLATVVQDLLSLVIYFAVATVVVG